MSEHSGVTSPIEPRTDEVMVSTTLHKCCNIVQRQNAYGWFPILLKSSKQTVTSSVVGSFKDNFCKDNFSQNNQCLPEPIPCTLT